VDLQQIGRRGPVGHAGRPRLELDPRDGHGVARKPVSGDDADAAPATDGRPATYPARPASTASLNAWPIATGSPAVPIAVLTSTASAPRSMASAACDGAPMPPSTTTGTSERSPMIPSAAFVPRPRV